MAAEYRLAIRKLTTVRDGDELIYDPNEFILFAIMLSSDSHTSGEKRRERRGQRCRILRIEPRTDISTSIVYVRFEDGFEDSLTIENFIVLDD